MRWTIDSSRSSSYSYYSWVQLHSTPCTPYSCVTVWFFFVQLVWFEAGNGMLSQVTLITGISEPEKKKVTGRRETEKILCFALVSASSFNTSLASFDFSLPSSTTLVTLSALVAPKIVDNRLGFVSERDGTERVVFCSRKEREKTSVRLWSLFPLLPFFLSLFSGPFSSRPFHFPMTW